MGGIKNFWINFLYFIFNVCSAIEFIIFPSEKALTDKFHSLLGVLSLPFFITLFSKICYSFPCKKKRILNISKIISA